MKKIFLILCCLLVPFFVQAQRAPDHSNAGGRHLGQEAEDFDVEELRRQIPEAAIEHAKNVQRQHEQELMERPGTHGTGIGIDSSGQPVIQIFTDPTDASTSPPPSLDGIPVQIIESGEFEIHAPVPIRNTLPALMGHELGVSFGGWAGTLGFRAHRVGHPEDVGFVTNNHTAAMADGSWGCWTAISPPTGTFFLASYNRPLCFPGTCTYDIGNLVQTVPIIMGGQYLNTVDASFVSSDRTRVSDDVIGLEPIRNSNVLDPFLMMPVQKRGTGSGLTPGYVSTINATLNVNSNCGVARFVNQVLVTPNAGHSNFSIPGDSGSSVWLNNLDPQLVGLLFAGNSIMGYGVINPISAVLGALGVVPDFSGTPDPVDQVTVPNVVGMQEAAARTSITNADLVPAVQYASNSAPSGTVFDQDPDGGTQIDRGSTVTLWVSTGPGNVTVPNVVGMSESAATTAIQNAGLVVGAISRVNNSAPAGTVISQSPIGGASVPPGSSVTLTISLGPAQVSVPNVINMTETAATTAIQNAGLVVGTITRVNNAAPAGTVIGQSPTGGTQVSPGSSVNLTVSLGPSGGPVYYYREAENFNSMFGIVAETGTPGSSGTGSIGYIGNGDWVQYDGINIPRNGTYTIRFRVATWGDGRTINITNPNGPDAATLVNIPRTGSGYFTWATVSTTMPLTAQSSKSLRFTFNASMNIDYFEIELN